MIVLYCIHAVLSKQVNCGCQLKKCWWVAFFSQ